MRIAVIGAGIAGISTAYELACDGHEVTVWEQHSAVAEEASFAHAGLLAPSLLVPFSHGPWPGTSWLRRLRGTPGIGRKHAGLADWQWQRQWNRRVDSDTFRARLQSAHQLLAYSQARLHALTAELGLNFERSEGLLALLRTPAVAAQWKPRLELLRSLGIVLRELSPEQARAIEPALDAHLPLHSALQLPNDEVGNCRQFSQLLRDKALELGVRFQMGSAVSRITTGPQPMLHLAEGAEPRPYDQLVVCAGSATARLVPGKLPLTSLHGYTVSSHLREPLNAPRSAVLDLENQVCIVRMGARIRASGQALLGTPAAAHRAQALKQLYGALQNSFPGATSLHSAVQVWQGCSTMSPDGLPLVGATASPGVWVNTGHGSNGWGMACGTARLLADALGGREPALAVQAFAPTRFGS